VDDNPTFLRIVGRFLQQSGEINVAGTADGGDEALAKAPDLRPDVILVDLAMPGMSGLALVPRLRRLVPEAGTIVLTLLDTEMCQPAVLTVGAHEFISESTMYEDLLPTIRRLAPSARTRRA
jgi:DNA-binding NarL/FixJ family response regulator